MSHLPPAILRFDALGVADGLGAAYSPGSVLIQWLPTPDPAGFRARLIAAGRTQDLAAHEAATSPGLRVVSLPTSILIPGLVNAHTHLDLTHIGPQPYAGSDGGGFVAWVEMIRRQRRHEPDQIAASVRRGIELSLAAGVVAVGDIAGAPGGRPNLSPWRTLRDSALTGVSFLEFFGIGQTQDRAAAAVQHALDDAEPPTEPGQARLGLQPHAPNTVAPALYRRAASWSRAHALPLATHLAETPEEREFIARGTGPQRALLERLGIWDDSILKDLGHGRSPVDHLAEILSETPFLVAHVNDADDGAIRTLARTRTMITYCPQASAYFGAEHTFGPHRYRQMLAEGIPVALGTDSIVNLRPGCGMSILDEMRFLHARDGTDPVVLLRMATINGAKALGLPQSAFAFVPGSPLAGLAAVEAGPSPGAGNATNVHGSLLAGDHPKVRLLFGRNHSDLAEIQGLGEASGA